MEIQMKNQLYFDEYSNDEIRVTTRNFVEYLGFCNGHVYDERTYNALFDAKEYLDELLEDAFIEIEDEEQV